MSFIVSEIDHNEGLTSLLGSVPASEFHSFCHNPHLVLLGSSVKDSLAVEPSNGAKEHIVQARDDKTGHICGASWWKFYCSTEGIDKVYVDTIPHNSFQRSWSGNTGKISKTIGICPTSKPHVFLYALVSYGNPNEQNICHRLLYWGIERADLLGLAVWVYATPSQASFYQSHGFEVVGNKAMETGRGEGSSKPVTCFVMRRSAEENRVLYRKQYLNTGGFC